MARTPTAADLEFVRDRTRSTVRGQRPRLSQFWGMAIPPRCTVAPVASGTPSVGSTLSCTQGTWENSPTSYEYRWRRDLVIITGAPMTATYVVVTADQGTAIGCQVRAINAAGPTNAGSNTLNIPPAAPTNTTAPVATGTGTVGQLLSCTTGAWTGSPIGYTYRWQRNGTDIVLNGGASTYTLIAADSGTNVRCTVIAANAGGNSAVANSNAIAVT